MNLACDNYITKQPAPFFSADIAGILSTYGRVQNGVRSLVQSFSPTAADSSWERIFDEIRELSLLLGQIEPGDDIPPDKSTVDLAVSVAMRLQRSDWESPGSVYPGVSCSVIMEWRYGEDIREIEVFKNGHAVETWYFGDGKSSTVKPFLVQARSDYK